MIGSFPVRISRPANPGELTNATSIWCARKLRCPTYARLRKREGMVLLRQDAVTKYYEGFWI
jgi:hypothetical protein